MSPDPQLPPGNPQALAEALARIRDCLKDRRSEDELGECLGQVFSPEILQSIGGDLSDEQKRLISPDGKDVLLSALHYTSYSVGTWARTLFFPDPAIPSPLEITPLELAQHQRMYLEAPRDINVPVWETLTSPLVIRFGDGAIDGTQPDDYNLVTISTQSLDHLRHHLSRRTAGTRFYDVSLGLLRPVAPGKPAEGDKDSQVLDQSLTESKLKWVIESAELLRPALLSLRDLEPPRDGRKKKRPNGVDDDDIRLWRALVFSFFLSFKIRQGPSTTVVIPLADNSPFMLSNDFPLSRVATFVVSLGGSAGSQWHTIAAAVRDATHLFMPGVRVLSSIEFEILKSRQSTSDVVLIENIVRTCTVLDPRVQLRENRYLAFLKENLADIVGSKSPPKELAEIWEMTGANSEMLQILSRVKDIVRATEKDPDGDGQKPKKGVSVFLHSEPGCGKERLARLCHLLSDRCYARAGAGTDDQGTNDAGGPGTKARGGGEHTAEQAAKRREAEAVLRNCARIPPRLREALHRQLASHRTAVAEHKALVGKALSGPDVGHEVEVAESWTREQHERLKKLGEQGHGSECWDFLREFPLVAQRVLNCAELDGTNAQSLLFGSLAKPGILLTADSLNGSVFLDEVNTVDPRVANRLLRVLDKPYEIVLNENGTGKVLRVDLLVVFGSNKSPEQLIAEKFNPAIVFRIAARPFRIPPLRRRKEDIALFVNHYVQTRCLNKNPNDELAASGPSNESEHLVLAPLRRFSLDGLRLLCELPWLDNYRGVKALLDDIIEERCRRSLKNAEISFDEVIRAVSRREAMGRHAGDGGQ